MIANRTVVAAALATALLAPAAVPAAAAQPTGPRPAAVSAGQVECGTLPDAKWSVDYPVPNVDVSTDPQLRAGLRTLTPVGTDPFSVTTDKLVVTGTFTSIGGVARPRIAQLKGLSSTGPVVDGAFDPGTGPAAGDSANPGGPGIITSVARQADGKFVVVGLFRSFNGTNANNIVRLHASGRVDTSFASGAGLDRWRWDQGSVAVLPDGKILVAGSFGGYNGAARTNIVRINADGTLDTTFAPGTGFGWAAGGLTSTVYDVAVQPDGKILAVGNFTSFNGTSRGGVARLNSNGTLDTGFNPGSGVAYSQHAERVALRPDGKILVAGQFSTFDGAARNGAVLLTSSGAVDASFSSGAGFGKAIDLSGLVATSDNSVWATGVFDSYNGQPAGGLVRILPDGKADPTRRASFSWRAGRVIPLNDGRVLAPVDSDLTTYGGQPTRGMIRLGDACPDAVAAPGLGGAPAVGRTLTATAPTTSPQATSWAWQWLRDGTAIVGATSQSYTPVQADLGKQLSVKAGTKISGRATTTIASDGAPVVKGAISGGAVTVTGDAAVGRTLTAAAGTTTPVAQTTWAWSADGTPIAGATETTLTLTPALLGKKITATATHTADGYNDAAHTSAATVAVVKGAISGGSVTLSGDAAVGKALTAAAGTTTPVAQTTWAWSADGTPIAGATGTTLTLTPALLGKKITATATHTADGYNDAAHTSAATFVVEKGTLAVSGTRPTITGTPGPGGTLTANPPAYATSASTSWQWFSDDAPITGATGTSLEVSPALNSKTITVQATAIAAGYQTWTATSAGVTVGGYCSLAKPLPSITGQAKVGQQLSISVPSGLFTPAGCSTSWKWLADGDPISGSDNKSSYTPDGSRAGARISLVFTATASNQPPASATTEMTDPVAKGDITGGGISIYGDAKVGQTLNIGGGGTTPPGNTLNIAWRWIVDGQTVGTRYSLVVTPPMLGKPVSAEVTYSAPGYNDHVRTSDPTSPVVKGTISGAVASVTGNPAVGQTLTAALNTSQPSSTNANWRWYANGTPIAGATGNRLLLIPTLLGKSVTAEATITADGYEDATRSASASGPVIKGDITGGDVSIKGKAIVGRTLTAEADDTDPSGTAINWRWMAGGTPIAGATGPTLTLAPTLAGDIITVEATHRTDGYQDLVRTSSPAGPVDKADMTGGHVTIAGEATVGRVLAAVTADTNPAGTAVTWRWLADGSPISGATSDELLVGASLVDRSLSVIATHRASGYNDLVRTAEMEISVSEGNFNGAEVNVEGVARVGERAVARIAAASPDPDRVSWQWQRDGRDIAGATTNTRTLTAADMGHEIRAVAVLSRDGYIDFEANSAVGGYGAQVAPGELALTSRPTITGASTAGELLAANLGGDTADATVAWQWLRGGRPIPRATNIRYRIQPTDAETKISVRVTVSKDGYIDWISTSDEIGPVDGYLSVNPNLLPSITGIAQVGGQLNLSTPNNLFSPNPDKTELQWMADGTPITGATGPTWTPDPARLGTHISVRITALTGDDQLTINTPATGPVAEGQISGVKATIDGTAQVGRILNATAASTPPAKASWTWHANGRTVGTGPRLLLTPDTAGTRITATAQLTSPGYQITNDTSEPTNPVANGELAGPDDHPNIYGWLVPGGAAQAQAPDYATETVLSWQWFADGQPIPGATADTYPIPFSAQGKKLSVTASAEANGYDQHVSTSTETPPVSDDIGLPPGSLPDIEGTPKVGQQLDVTLSEGEGQPAISSWTWVAEDEPVAGSENTNTFLLNPTHLDKHIGVRVLVTHQPDGASEPVSAWALVKPVGPVELGDTSTSGRPQIVGEARAGSQLHAEIADFASDPTGALSWQWVANGEPIPGATGETLDLSDDLVGSLVTLIVTAAPAASLGYAPTSATSETVLISARAFAAAGVQIRGAYAGQPATAEASFDPAPDTVEYVWSLDGEIILDARGRSYTPTGGQAGRELSVTATARRDGYENVTASSEAITIGKGQIKSADAEISGISQVGRSLTATASSVPQANASWQWLRNGEPIPEATSNTYQLRASDLGRNISVRALLSTTGYEDAETTSDPTAPVQTIDGVETLTTTPGQIAGQLVVTWVLPEGTPDGALIMATAQPGGASCSAIAPATNCTITDLNPATSYVVTVTITWDGITTNPSKPTNPIQPGGCLPVAEIMWMPKPGWAKKSYIARTGKPHKVAFLVNPTTARPILQRKLGKKPWKPSGKIRGNRAILHLPKPTKRITASYRLFVPASPSTPAARSNTFQFKIVTGKRTARAKLTNARPIQNDSCRTATTLTWNPSSKLVRANNRLAPGKRASVNIRITGGKRAIILQYRQGNTWINAATIQSSTSGIAKLRLTGSKSKKTWRLLAPATTSFNAALSRKLAVRPNR